MDGPQILFYLSGKYNYVVNPFESPAILSLCPGTLGLERGLARAIGSLNVVAYLENEAFLVENLLAGMEAGILAPAPVWTNVKTFDPRPFRGKISGIIGGYPCQPYSVAGNRKGSEDPRHLWPYIDHIIDAVGPFFCWFENVGGHLTTGFEAVYRSLSAMGYHIEAGLFTAQEVGAPHLRERLFILAVLDDAKDYLRRLYQRQGRCAKTAIDIDGSGEAMANAQSLRIQGSGTKGQQEPPISVGKGLFGRDGQGVQRWPSRPGESQQAWESPRLISREIESGMGIAVDGYNFREDLLRALGNRVVEQQAENAFRVLCNKMLEV